MKLSTISSRAHWAAPVLAAIVYIATLPPTITGEDSGEFVTAAYTLGIPHPPGYPLYCLVGHIFTQLPWESVAWRVNLMSAVFGALAVGLLAQITFNITRSQLAALAAGLSFAFSRELWEQALIAEVYTLNACLVILCLWALWKYRLTQQRRWLYLLAGAVALALGTHNTILLLAPLFAFYAIWVTPRPWRLWKTWLGCSALAASGVLFYLYLPWRSAADPPMDWGNPESLEAAWAVMTREQFQFMMYEAPRTLPRFALQLLVYLDFWLREFTPWVAGAGLAGLIMLYVQRRCYAILLFLVAFFTVAAFSLVQNFDFDKEWLWVMTVFGIPAYAVTALGIGCCIAGIAGKWGSGAGCLLAVIAMASPFFAHLHHNNRSHDYWAHDYARNVLETLPPGAILVPETDLVSFGTVYLQAIEGRRPDVTVARKYGYLDLGVLPDFPETLRAQTGDQPPRRYEPMIFEWLLGQTDRPVFFEKPLALEGIRWQGAGLLQQALRPGETPAVKDYWAAYTWHTLNPRATRGDYTAEAILLAWNLARARDLLEEGDEGAALRQIEAGLEVYGREVQALNNAGVLCARYRFYEKAFAYFSEALALAPKDATVQSNLERARDKLR